MKILHILFFFVGFNMASMAQSHEELVLNGGFEAYRQPQPGGNEQGGNGGSGGSFDPYLKPLYWNFTSTLSQTRTKTAHSGEFAIEFYPNGGSFLARDKDFNTHYIKVKGGAEYEVSYWYRGSVDKPNISVSIEWYKGERIIKREERNRPTDLARAFSAQWQQKKLMFKAPAGAESASLTFNIALDEASAKHGKTILIDDISMTMQGEGEEPVKPEPPANLRAWSHQREMELSWSGVTAADVSYEIYVDGALVGTTQATKHVIAHLMPGKRYAISLRTVKGGMRSDFSKTLNQTALPLEYDPDDEDRIPYLYTVREVGTAPRTLPLYFHELATADAKITCWVDGVPTTPVNDAIVFANKGRHTLRIEIEETPERKWNIEYNINVD